jgi:hypothetical protein
MKERKYPIYHVSARWDQDDFEGNGSGYSRMYREDPGDMAYIDAVNWWFNMLITPSRRDKIPLIEKHPKLIGLRCELVGYEAWCLTWFSHYTYNIHLTDEELLASFDQFVWDKLPLHRNLEIWPPERRDPNMKTYCLMGAEDRWRWKGPCHCKHCKAQGITRIDH